MPIRAVEGESSSGSVAMINSDSDLDQRHTFNLYGTYRLSPRTSVSGKLRMGSNFPAPGYYDESDGRYYVGETKNDSGCRRSLAWICGSTGPSRGRPVA